MKVNGSSHHDLVSYIYTGVHAHSTALLSPHKHRVRSQAKEQVLSIPFPPPYPKVAVPEAKTLCRSQGKPTAWLLSVTSESPAAVDLLLPVSQL